MDEIMRFDLEKLKDTKPNGNHHKAKWVMIGSINLNSKDVIGWLISKVRRTKKAHRLVYDGKPVFTGKYNGKYIVAITNNIKGSTRTY